MAAIKLLEESIAQKIAAGEVVERPSSVIKELTENSVDAGSSFITVEIKEGGIEHIRVTDNGCGIPRQEVELAFLRHATSKIQTLQDLYNITQMGFRGEALYSIAAVSKLELTTKPAEQTTGAKFIINGGKVISLNEYGCPDGTTITVNGLFYNTPARLKFLAKPSVEAGYVGTAIYRLILAKPGISIKFISNDKVMYHSAGDGSLKNAIYVIFGKEVAQGLIPVKQYIGNTSIEGFLFSPKEARSNRSAQMLVVNGRPVSNLIISGIVERLFGGLTESRRFPGYVLNLNLPPAEVDVNVHPNKLQVRFSNEYQIKQLVETAVAKALLSHTSQPVAWEFKQAEKIEVETRLEASKQDDTIQQRPYTETVAEAVGRFTQDVGLLLGNSKPLYYIEPLMQKPSIANIAANGKNDQQSFSGKQPVITIGQLFDTYVLAEHADKLLIIDQHAAHERMWYDKYRLALENAQPCSQKLLIPQIVTVSYEIKAALDDNLVLLSKLGFEVEEYGRLTYQVRAVPFVLGQPQVQDFLIQVLDMLSEDRSVRTNDLKQEKIMSMACKKAVKSGDKLDQSELAALADILSAEATPLTCPHGRPFVITMDRHSLDKQFRRVK